MGYDTLSANTFRQGNTREDTQLLGIAEEEGRILLTCDRELARRAGDRGVLILSEIVWDQMQQLVSLGLIDPELVMDRCSLCNRMLRPASREEVASAGYAPHQQGDLEFFWCEDCHKLYWMGTHGRNLRDDMNRHLHRPS